MERTTFEEWWGDELLTDTGDAYDIARKCWTAAKKEAAAVARACCEVYGAEFADAVYDKVMEGNEHVS